jgi:hypothetical protein
LGYNPVAYLVSSSAALALLTNVSEKHKFTSPSNPNEKSMKENQY